MSPLLVPLIQGAIEIFKSKDAFKENLKKPSTIAAIVPALTAIESVSNAGFVPADNLESAITQVVSGLLFLGLFFLRKAQAKN